MKAAVCTSFYCLTIHQREHKIASKQLTLWCWQQEPFINTLMMEIVVFTQYALRHNEFRATNWNIFSFGKHRHLNNHWFVTWYVDTSWWVSSEPTYLAFQIINNAQRKENNTCTHPYPTHPYINFFNGIQCLLNAEGF